MENTAEGAVYSNRVKMSENQHIQVFVRVRPMSSNEKIKNPVQVVDCPGTKEVFVKDRSSSSKTFTFDKVFKPNSKQIDVYKSVVAPLLEDVMMGYNCTVFAYGQTGTGKTYTMEGERTKQENLSWENDPLAGIVPRALSQLFDELRVQNAEFTVRVSLLELYNEELFDLLAPIESTKLLRIYEDSNRKGSVLINGLEEVTVNNKHDVYKIMEQGNERRKTATTQMNQNSSRSHTVFTITVHIKESNTEGEELVKIGKLNLVDLAGSENIGRSGAVDKRAREAGSINQSLLTLGRVITSLVERTPHVPYRESKLTRILQDSLGGRTKTSIIATISPASINLEETLSTLDYAHRAKNITNRPEVNQKMTKSAVLKEYTSEIERLRKDLAACIEKNGMFVDKDNYAQMLSQIDSYKQEVSDKIVQAKAFEETILKKDEEIVELNKKQEELQDDLDNCNRLLKATGDELEQTRNILEMTKEERDQKGYLIEKHLATEKKLTREANQLLSTTDEATINLEKLYKKLDRKKVNEQSNIDAGNRFKSEMVKNLDGIYVAIESFRINHSTFCAEQRVKLGEYLQGKENKFQKVSESVNSLHQLISDEEAKNLVHKNILQIKTWNQDIPADVMNLKNAEDSRLGPFTTLIKEKIFNIENQLLSLKDSSSEIWEFFSDSLNEQHSSYEDFIMTRFETFLEREKQVLQIQKEQKESNLELSNSIEELNKKHSNQIDTIIKTLSDLKEKAEHNKTEFSSSIQALSEKTSKSTQFNKNISESIERNIKSTEKDNDAFFKKSNEDIEKIRKEAGGKQKELLESFVTSGKVVKEISSNFQESLDVRDEIYKNAQEDATKKQKERQESLSQFSDKFTELYQNSQSSMMTKADELKTGAGDSFSEDSAHVLCSQNELEEHCTLVSNWMEEQRGEMAKQSGKVTEFWDSTYLLDSPTGATPQRKSYDYPRKLSCTSPHERLLRRRFANNNSSVKIEEEEGFDKENREEVF